MKRHLTGLLLLLATLGSVALIACASMTTLQRVQQSHDWLALAQDTEANLCWGLPSIAAVDAAHLAPNHCVAPIAATIHLTDDRQQAFNRLMKKALDDHIALTKLAKAGSTPIDTATIDADVAALINLVAALTQENVDVVHLIAQLKKAGH